jgi:hypothetical protein
MRASLATARDRVLALDWALYLRVTIMVAFVWPLQYLVVIPTVLFVAPLVFWVVWRRVRRTVTEHTAVAGTAAAAVGAVAYANRDEVATTARRARDATVAALHRFVAPWGLGWVMEAAARPQPALPAAGHPAVPTDVVRPVWERDHDE